MSSFLHFLLHWFMRETTTCVGYVGCAAPTLNLAGGALFSAFPASICKADQTDHHMSGVHTRNPNPTLTLALTRNPNPNPLH